MDTDGYIFSLNKTYKCEKFIEFLTALYSVTKINLNSNLKELTQTEFLLMFFIKNYNTGGVHVSVLAEELDVSVPAVSRALNALEKKNYILRCIDKSNRRNISVTITTDGLDIFKSESDIVKNVFDKIVEKMGKEKVKELIKLSLEFSKIVQEIESGTQAVVA